MQEFKNTFTDWSVQVASRHQGPRVGVSNSGERGITDGEGGRANVKGPHVGEESAKRPTSGAIGAYIIVYGLKYAHSGRLRELIGAGYDGIQWNPAFTRGRPHA
nr:hypothetical protein MACL_00003045 [Theileria orientalis]